MHHVCAQVTKEVILSGIQLLHFSLLWFHQLWSSSSSVLTCCGFFFVKKCEVKVDFRFRLSASTWSVRQSSVQANVKKLLSVCRVSCRAGALFSSRNSKSKYIPYHSQYLVGIVMENGMEIIVSYIINSSPLQSSGVQFEIDLTFPWQRLKTIHVCHQQRMRQKRWKKYVKIMKNGVT